MVRDFWILSILLVLAGIAVQADLPEGKNWVNNVSRVVDGETIVVMHDGEPETVRLYGVDCPDDGQPFADEARTYTSVLVLRKSVDVHPVGKDTSGKTVAWVFQKGKNVNHLLVGAGLAWWSRQDAPSDRKLQELERQARAGRRRMWVQDNPVAPWDYRQESMKKKKTGPEDTVYVTRVDSTYHRAGCPLLRRSIINLLSAVPMSLPDARVKYKPCPVCDPPR
jgi:micrococcal nuclease